jgi:hypothetical protein
MQMSPSSVSGRGRFSIDRANIRLFAHHHTARLQSHIDGAHRIYGPVQVDHQPPRVRHIYALRLEPGFVNIGGAKLRGLQPSFVRQFRSDRQVIFVQVDPRGVRSFGCGPSSDVAQPTTKLHETVPRNESGPPQQFASSAIVNCTDNAQAVVVTSPGPQQVLVSNCRHWLCEV